MLKGCHFEQAMIEAEQTYPSQQDNDLTSGSVPQLKEDSSGQRSQRVARRQRKANVNQGVKDATAAQVETPADELDVLDEENRRLKGLLANHLHQENMQLRMKLASFGVI